MSTAQVDEAIREHYRLLVGIARSILGSQADAEDVVQNALVSYLADDRRDEPTRALLAWLVRKRCLDELRARQGRRQRQASVVDLDALCAASSVEPLEAIVTREALAELTADVERLPTPQRRALMLVAEGSSHEAVADRLGLTVSASRALVARARDNLRFTRAARATSCAEIRLQGAAASRAGVRAPELVRRHLWTCMPCRLQVASVRERARGLRQRAAALVPGPIAVKLALALAVLGGGVGAVALRPWHGRPAPPAVRRAADEARRANARVPLPDRADVPSAPMVEVARHGALRLYAQRSTSGAWCVAGESGASVSCVPARVPERIWLSVGSGGRVDGRVLTPGAVRVLLRVDGRPVATRVGRAGFFTARAPGVVRPPTEIPAVHVVARNAAGHVVARWPASPGGAP